MNFDDNITQHLKALEFFKDWSNYLLVTTVAALGWVATANRATLSPWATCLVILFFGLSIAFGIFTLALIPVVAESITEDTKSFYEVSAGFNLILDFNTPWSVKLKWVCWPQHVLFLAGIVTYTAANIFAVWKQDGRHRAVEPWFR
jgi:hypothetical protein